MLVIVYKELIKYREYFLFNKQSVPSEIDTAIKYLEKYMYHNKIGD